MEETIAPSIEAQPDATQQTQQNAGIQLRIDQLVAEREKERSRADQLQAQVMESLQRLTEAQTRQAAPAPVDPYAAFADKVDPNFIELMRKRDAELAAQNRQLAAQANAAQAAQLAQLTVQQLASQMPGVPASVTQRAQELARGWRMQGLNFPEGDAINFAMGEHYVKVAAATKPHVHNPATQQAFQPIQGQPSAATTKLPPNFEQLSPAQQNAFYDAQGDWDKPF